MQEETKKEETPKNERLEELKHNYKVFKDFVVTFKLPIAFAIGLLIGIIFF